MPNPSHPSIQPPHSHLLPPHSLKTLTFACVLERGRLTSGSRSNQEHSKSNHLIPFGRLRLFLCLEAGGSAFSCSGSSSFKCFELLSVRKWSIVNQTWCSDLKPVANGKSKERSNGVSCRWVHVIASLQKQDAVQSSSCAPEFEYDCGKSQLQLSRGVAELGIGEVAREGDRKVKLKVMGLGTRAATIISFCKDSGLLPFAEFGSDQSGLGTFQNTHLPHPRSSERTETISYDGQQALECNDMTVLVVGGGGTRHEIACDLLSAGRLKGGLAVSVITQPFAFEGRKRLLQAQQMIDQLQKHTDLLFVIQSDALLNIGNVTLEEASKAASKATLFAIKAVYELLSGKHFTYSGGVLAGSKVISNHDILRSLRCSGMAQVGYGHAANARTAIEMAILKSPFLYDIVGAKASFLCTLSNLEKISPKSQQLALEFLRHLLGSKAELFLTCIKDATLSKGCIMATVIVFRLERKTLPAADVASTKACSKAIWGITVPNNDDGCKYGEHEGYSHSMNASKRSSSMWFGQVSNIQDSACQNNGTLRQFASSTSVNLEKITSEQSLATNISDNEISADTPIYHDPRSRPRALCNRNSLTGVTSIGNGISQDGEKGAVPENPQSSGTLIGIAENGNLDNLKVTIARSGAGDPASADDFSQNVDGSQNIISSRMGDSGSAFWNCGPFSASAEAWANARASIKEKSAGLGHCDDVSIPIGVRLKDQPQNEASVEFSQEASQLALQPLPVDPDALPRSMVVGVGLGAIADIYRAASTLFLRRDAEEHHKELSVMQRAASMLEQERGNGISTPIFEINYKNGIYKGRCEGGVPDGKGRITYADGSFYDGHWKEGKRLGSGSFYYANGDVYQGSWKDDQMDGQGWLYFNTGDRFHAAFSKGKANGEGRLFSARGDVFVGKFQDNWRHGESLFIESTGVRWYEVWKDGALLSRKMIEDSKDLNGYTLSQADRGLKRP